MSEPPRKTDLVIAAMKRSDYVVALRIAKSFRMLTAVQKTNLVRAHEALHHPGTYRQLGYDPDELFRLGVATLQELYGSRICPLVYCSEPS
jgi:hypothetical protein